MGRRIGCGEALVARYVGNSALIRGIEPQFVVMLRVVRFPHFGNRVVAGIGASLLLVIDHVKPLQMVNLDNALNWAKGS
jgi:hypothetical protein